MATGNALEAIQQHAAESAAVTRDRHVIERRLQAAWAAMVAEVGYQCAMEAIGREIESTAREAGSWNRQELFIRAESVFNFAAELGTGE